MNGRVKSILEHMLEDAKDIIVFSQTAGSLKELRKNSLIKKGVVMSLLNIGELASKLPNEFTDKHAQIPWHSLVGMRNFAAHGYHIMNLEIVWDTAQTSIPELIDFIEKVLKEDDTLS
ncbi:MAG: DUF86 domain-containing protein [Anaerolineaceae bacterium]|nr:DUF86 domain-containing protein [Anaerolineaceae bacterium]